MLVRLCSNLFESVISRIVCFGMSRFKCNFALSELKKVSRYVCYSVSGLEYTSPSPSVDAVKADLGITTG